MRTIITALAALALATPAWAGGNPDDLAAPAEEPHYDVSCPDGAARAEQCEVDKGTYLGWRTFSTDCQVCHGGSALGTTFAPNLMDRINKQGVDYGRYHHVVLEGFRGQVGAMPAWKGNTKVEKNLDNIWRYLKARADGVLPPGRPKRKRPAG